MRALTHVWNSSFWVADATQIIRSEGEQEKQSGVDRAKGAAMGVGRREEGGLRTDLQTQQTGLAGGRTRERGQAGTWL